MGALSAALVPPLTPGKVADLDAFDTQDAALAHEELARLQAAAAEHREALGAAERRAAAEASYRAPGC